MYILYTCMYIAVFYSYDIYNTHQHIKRWTVLFCAGDNSFEVPLVVISGQLRREMLRSIDKKKYSQVLVDAYTQEQLQSPGEFKGFLDRFRDVKNRILKDIGGASGLPSPATSATSAMHPPYSSPLQFDAPWMQGAVRARHFSYDLLCSLLLYRFKSIGFN